MCGWLEQEMSFATLANLWRLEVGRRVGSDIENFLNFYLKLVRHWRLLVLVYCFGLIMSMELIVFDRPLMGMLGAVFRPVPLMNKLIAR